jgi:hypothetical protein
MVSLIRSCSTMPSAGLQRGSERLSTGVHFLRRSLARQCGRRWEGVGVRFCAYGRGLLCGVGGVGGIGR